MRIESHLRVDRDLLLAVTSYGITLLRLLIAAVGALTVLRRDDMRFVVASVALVMALDYFDGATFDKSYFSAHREWRIRRRIADSVSDRLVIQIICIPLLIQDSSFMWLYLLILARELAISGYLFREFSKGILVYPRSISKIACGMVGMAVISFVTFPVAVVLMTGAVMITLSGFALRDYMRRVQSAKVSISPLTKPIVGLEEIF